MRLRALIVDDEPLAREGVALALRDTADVDIVGSCPDGPSAVRAIRDLAPDLVFLDIKMPGLDGFGVIDTVGPEHMPAVIFLTAYEEHAVQAFRVEAVDYLLKPVDPHALRESLERARRRIAEAAVAHGAERLRGVLEQLGPSPNGNTTPPDRVVVRAGGRVHLLDPREITWVEASGDYVTVHAGGKAHLVRDSIKRMETRLAQHGFRRIHRSAIVNVARVRELVASESGDYEVVLTDGTVVRLSRNFRDALYAALNAQA